MIERVAIAPDYEIARLIRGCWQLAGGHGAIDREDAINDLFSAAGAGVTTFDCADIYTGVEALIGEFLARWRQRFGAEAADRLQVHTKFVPDLDTLSSLSAAEVERAIDRSRARLGVARLDLVQFHWWDYDVDRYVEIAERLAALQADGRIRLLGATNFSTAALARMLDAAVRIATHQVQYSVLDRRPERGMADLCRRHGTALLCYGALAGGFISEKYLGRAAPLEPLANRSLVKYRLIIDEFGGWDRFQAVLRALATVAERRETDIPTVALRWVLDRPGVAAVIVGAAGAMRLQALEAVGRCVLDQEDLDRIDRACHDAPGPGGDVYEIERVKGGRHAAVMRYDLNARP
jgi:aryl-alcohol dehydrogenase-like predicted oxidoreductase